LLALHLQQLIGCLDLCVERIAQLSILAGLLVCNELLELGDGLFSGLRIG
jgi:hypothetical protein